MKPELLAPVSDLIMLKAAIESGADAVYFGLKELNMRIGLKGDRNFDIFEMKHLVDECHKRGIRSYLALNTIVFDDELDRIKDILKMAKAAKVDAVICWDMSVLEEARKLGLQIHLSTQASVANSESARFYKGLGVERIILARELSLSQIKQVKKIAKVPIEAFVHGAMCVSVSGRCFMSQFVFGKSANRGQCIQPCRREMIVTDEKGNQLTVGNNYILSPKDLCTIEILPDLVAANIDAFKIEGRNRSPEYVKTVVGCYREAIDFIIDKKIKSSEDKAYIKLAKTLLGRLSAVYNRGFSTGFYLGSPIDAWSGVYGSKATEKKVYVGFVKNFYKNVSVAEIRLETSDIEKGDRLMFQGSKSGVIEEKVSSMEIDHKKVTAARKGERVAVKTRSEVRQNDKVYKIVPA